MSELIDSLTFSSSIGVAKEDYVKIAEIIQNYIGEKSKAEFMKACEEADYNKANDLLDKTVEKMTGINNVSVALKDFADKFNKHIDGLYEEMEDSHSERDKVKIIASHYSEILKIIG